MSHPAPTVSPTHPDHPGEHRELPRAHHRPQLGSNLMATRTSRKTTTRRKTSSKRAKSTKKSSAAQAVPTIPSGQRVWLLELPWGGVGGAMPAGVTY